MPKHPNEKARVSGHFSSLEIARHGVNNLRVHKAMVLGHFTPKLKWGDSKLRCVSHLSKFSSLTHDRPCTNLQAAQELVPVPTRRLLLPFCLVPELVLCPILCSTVDPARKKAVCTFREKNEEKEKMLKSNCLISPYLNDQFVERLFSCTFCRRSVGELNEGALLSAHHRDGANFSELVKMIPERRKS